MGDGINMGLLIAMIEEAIPDADPAVIEQAVSDWLDDHPEATTTVQDGSITLAKLASDVTAKINQITSLSDEIDEVFTHKGHISDYLYKTNTYINSSGQETALNGIDLYKVPLSVGDCLLIKQMRGDTVFYNGLNEGYVCKAVKNGEFVAIDRTGKPEWYWYSAMTARSQLKIYGTSDVTALYFCVRTGNEGYLDIFINTHLPRLNDPNFVSFNNAVYNVEEYNSIVSNIYKGAKLTGISTSGYSIRSIKVNKDDRVYVSQKATGINYWGKFTACVDLSTVDITQEYTAPSDGFIDFFFYEADNIVVTVFPKNSIMIEYANVKNVPAVSNPFNALNAVAFGTSLTYRDQGYRANLATLLNMSIDNQGVGSSYWCTDAQNNSNVLYNVQNYASYAGKDVCIIEGCVNDWYYEHTIGTYKDTGTATVCGCLYNMISHVYTQNPNIQIFVILDHFGRNYSSVDCSSASLRGDKTQYEYYEELAKLCAFYGIPCIKEYEISSIGQFGTEYLADNIHLSALGGQQSAMVIANAMMQYGRKKTA